MPDENRHGFDGVIEIRRPPEDEIQPWAHGFVDACKQAGLKYLPDGNTADGHGVFYLRKFQAHGGRKRVVRDDTAHAYLRKTGAIKRLNLTVLCHTRAAKILTNGKRAVGVACVGTPQAQGNTQLPRMGGHFYLAAQREVVVCGGAFMSPQLLMLSGIGPKKELAKHGIPLVHDLPGVGKNLNDHSAFVANYSASRSSGGIGFHPVPLLKVVWELLKYAFKGGKGMFSSNLVHAMACIKTDSRLHVPDVCMMAIGCHAANHGKPFPFGLMLLSLIHI